MKNLNGQIQQGWYSGAEKKASPFFNERPATAIDTLVIHNISLPSGEFGNPFVHDLFMGCLDCKAHTSFADLAGLRVSAHFFISRSGKITQFVATDNRAWHAGVSELNGRQNVNDFSIGIELEGTDTIPYTDEQYQALQTLTAVLLQDYPIKHEHIVGHADVAPGRKTDPGSSFDWQRYKNALKTH